MLNQTVLMGRLTADPELRRTQSNTAVTSFSIAVERDIKDKNSEKLTDFIDIVAWGNTAEFVSRYFEKGRMIAVVGRLQTRTWEDKEGHRRKAVEVKADAAYFADSKRESTAGPGEPIPGAYAGPADPLPMAGTAYGGYGSYDNLGFGSVSDDDLPF